MKVNKIRKKIIINFSYSVIFAIIFAYVIHYKNNQSENGKQKIEKIQQQTSSIKINTESLQQRIENVKKYKESWSTISDNKKSTGGIKIDDINSKLAKSAAKYNISNPQIKINLPEEMKDEVFNCKTIIVISSEIQLNFSALDDTKAISFISDFTNNLNGYVVIQNLEIKKTKDYSEQDLIDISSGKPVNVIEGSVKFYWYSYKEKTN